MSMELTQARESTAPRGLPKIDFRAIISSPAFLPGLLVAVGLALTYLTLWRFLPNLWMQDEYYSHGFLVPVISGYVVFRWWPRIKDIPVKPGYFALVPLAAILWLTRITQLDLPIYQLMSVLFVAALLCGIWFVAGWRWALALSLPCLYLLFALPLWSTFIQTYTNPLQAYSTDVAYQLLRLFGYDPLREGANTIFMDGGFALNVAVPCSGLKLMLALSAFTAFFMMVARLKLWANLTMMALVVPLCLLMNGLRITMIGMVGQQWGEESGLKFHDYSGYITLILCFFILFKIARGLGWKD